MKMKRTRAKKIFTRNASKQFLKSMDKKAFEQLEADNREKLAVKNATKSVKANNKAKGHNDKMHSHLN